MRKITIACPCTITLNLDDDADLGEVLADIEPVFSRGGMDCYDIEDAIVHLNEAEVTDSR